MGKLRYSELEKEEIDRLIRFVASRIGAVGGRSRSPKKVEASRSNLARARKFRWKNKG